MTARVLPVLFGLLLLMGVPGAASSQGSEQQGLVDKARLTVESLTRDPNLGLLRRYLPRARGVLIVPQMLKAGFIIGGSGGSGVLLGRDGDGSWSPPAFYTIGAGSVGLQIGAEASELVLVIQTEKGLNSLLETNVTLGAEASVAAGPVGLGGDVATAPNLAADIIAFAKSKGLFAGAALEGAVVAGRDSHNAAYYGQPVSATDIIIRRKVDNPAADALRRAVTLAASPK